MKIIFFIDSFSTGGKERRLLELMKGLKAQPDIEFELVIMSKEVHYKEVYDLGVKTHFIVRKTSKDFSVFAVFYKLCKAAHADIVHCWDSMTAVYLAPVAKALRIKLVNGMVVDAPAKRNFRNKNWVRAKFTFPFSHIVVGNSKAGLLAYGAPAGKSICIYNGFNFRRSQNLAEQQTMRTNLGIETNFIIGMVAGFSIFKDYKTFYQAAALLLEKRKDITFLCVGDATDSDASKNNVDPTIQSHFKFLGRRSDVESLVNIMDIGDLSTFTEGISNSILEYMALAKPVIATDGGGTSEIVEDGVTGFLIGQGHAPELADKMELLLNNNELRQKMGMAGKEKIENKFLLSNMVQTYIVNYRKLMMKN